MSISREISESCFSNRVSAKEILTQTENPAENATPILFLFFVRWDLSGCSRRLVSTTSLCLAHCPQCLCPHRLCVECGGRGSAQNRIRCACGSSSIFNAPRVILYMCHFVASSDTIIVAVSLTLAAVACLFIVCMKRICPQMRLGTLGLVGDKDGEDATPVSPEEGGAAGASSREKIPGETSVVVESVHSVRMEDV